MEISITAGTPTETELAALVLALSLSPRPSEPARREPVPAWNDPGRRLGGHRDWRSSTLP